MRKARVSSPEGEGHLKEDQAPQARTVDHALSLLLMFRDHETISSHQVAEAVGVSKTAAFRLIATLLDRGFLRKAPGRQYAMGPVLVHLVRRFQESQDIVSIARPVMKALHAETRESIFLSVPSGRGSYLLVAGLESPQPVRWVGKIGEQSALFAGSGGKAHLASLPDPEIEALLENADLVAYTTHTITDKAALWEDIRRIRRQGYAISYGERYIDACGISVPIVNYRGTGVAVLSIYLPMVRAERLGELIAKAVQGARTISELLKGDDSE